MAVESRDYGGVLTSAERLYLDRHWQDLGVNPLDDRVGQIEGRLIKATLEEQNRMQREQLEKFNRSHNR